MSSISLSEGSLTRNSTLFWAGATFAPSVKVSRTEAKKAINIQQYLQDAFLAAFDKLLEATADIDSVMGYEVISSQILARQYALTYSAFE